MIGHQAAASRWQHSRCQPVLNRLEHPYGCPRTFCRWSSFSSTPIVTPQRRNGARRTKTNSMINMATSHRWGRVCSPSGWRSRSQLLSRILHAVEGRAAVLSSSRMQVARAQLLGGKSAVLRPPIRTGLTASRPPDDCRARRRAGRARSTLSTAERRRKGRARPSTPRSMVRCRERGLCAMIASCRARASAPHARDARGGSIIGMRARDHFPPTQPFGRANMPQARTPLRARTTFSRAESHLSHLIPPNPT